MEKEKDKEDLLFCVVEHAHTLQSIEQTTQRNQHESLKVKSALMKCTMHILIASELITVSYFTFIWGCLICVELILGECQDQKKTS